MQHKMNHWVPGSRSQNVLTMFDRYDASKQNKYPFPATIQIAVSEHVVYPAHGSFSRNNSG